MAQFFSCLLIYIVTRFNFKKKETFLAKNEKF